MKTFILILIAMTSLAQASSKLNATGKVKLGGKVHDVTIACKMSGLQKDNFVKLGTEVYTNLSGNCSDFNARHVVQVNGRVEAQKTIMVSLDEDFLKLVKQDKNVLKEEFNLSDAELAAIKCGNESNAFIMIGDDISMEIALNCATLKTK